MKKEEKRDFLAYRYILKHALPKLQKKGIKLVLGFDSDYVGTGALKCSGYFDPDEKELVCAVGNKKTEDWFGTFLHEFSHFEQWVENCPAWRESQGEGASDQALDDYIEGKLPKSPKIEKMLRDICYLEYDCERRTVKKFLQLSEIFSLSDVGVYVQKANAYVAFYRKVYDLQTWYDAERAPYLNEDFWKHMPAGFLPFECYFDKVDDAFLTVDWSLCLPKTEEDK